MSLTRITNALSYLRYGADRSPPRFSLDFTNKSKLEQLPVDVLLCIADALPLHCAALLTLSSKTLRYKIRDVYLRHFNAADKYEFKNNYFTVYGYDGRSNKQITPLQAEYVSFLTLVAEDIPDKVFCHFCQIIHAPSKADGHGLAVHKQPLCYESGVHDILDCGRHFNFLRINLAVKRARHGLDPSKQLRTLGKSFVKRSPYWNQSCYARNQSSLEARIVNQKMYIRLVYPVLIPRKTLPDIPTSSEWELGLCTHLEYGPRWQSDGYGRYIALKAHILRTLADFHRGKRVPGNVIDCGQCATEFVMEVQDDRWGSNVRLVVTVWKDLGRGNDPFDPAYQSHFEPWLQIPHSLRGIPAGSIRDAFESDQAIR